ncbi:sigma-70 family RNA polymerase sigma factor [Roseofilum sp. Belize Diploria]|uniref:RNA polymerase sigma factor n=1 Tax=Roseofilum sp. Belize Diploria TaxID=2821501 RepID=UPI000E7FE412|nr:sigma-70 family RNA polymerase sigma factor [Roseofilum sp. Belize Diploria]MBP0009250.1 sigma-70 family RNA polymerase sigma factor [Roseofilum sp. Belize Diploria]HBR00294.1 RNA polymerase sigma factor [Cyanobacteria bacterium UBA11691]
MQGNKLTSNTSSGFRTRNKDLDVAEEEHLLQCLSEGDMNAFWPLWQSYQEYLYFRCLRWLNNDRHEAEDALSLAMLKASKALPNYAHKITNLRAWLTRLTYNLCMDKYRQDRRRAIGVENIDEIAAISLDSLLISYTSPESTLLSEELSRSIVRAINMLPERLRQLFILRYYHQVSCADIAQQLGISQDNAYKRIQEAKECLKKHLGHYLSGQKFSVLHSSLDGENYQISVDKGGLSDPPSANNTRSINSAISYHITATCIVKFSHLLL